MDARNPRHLRQDTTLCKRAMVEVGAKEMGREACEVCIAGERIGLHGDRTCQHWAERIYGDEPSGTGLAKRVLSFLRRREDWRLMGAGLKQAIYDAPYEQVEMDHA